ncbi:hypothetical protein A3Q56_08553 [Intoshia linei]|uniref:Uncharacterized protein n=1 Tax=Intoshia linei TaxID=1819745 RepID=A0A177AQQ9_9BILA|nr:hypothetical protein A3Q56_08553 [Intoshia linei]
MILDTGSEVSLLPSHIYENSRCDNLIKSYNTLRSFSGHSIQPRGWWTAECKFGNKDLKFFIIVNQLWV